MTDLFSYHLARDQMADLRRTAGQTRLTTTTNHRSLTNGHRVVQPSAESHLDRALD